jgi:hypothetical protein
MAINLSSFASNARSLVGSASQTLGTAAQSVNTLKSSAAQGLAGVEAKVQALTAGVGSVTKFASAIRSASLPPGGVASTTSSVTPAEVQNMSQPDWRVKLSLPSIPEYSQSEMLAPLKDTDGLVFPYTPTVMISHTANYQNLSPMHNNYPFLAYENSRIDNINISGEFYCEDSVQARYWVAAMHYLRSVTKMFYGGEDANAGAPPPVVRLQGYGDYVFKNVPVVVTNFSLEMPNDVDYISTGLGQFTYDEFTGSAIPSSGGVSYAPVKSLISVQVQPLYSREQVRQFSLAKFVRGDYVKNGNGFI